MSVSGTCDENRHDGNEIEHSKRTKLINLSINQIVKSVQDVIEVSNNNEFKQHCLDVIDADDFEEFHRKTKRRLTKLLKPRDRFSGKKKTMPSYRQGKENSQLSQPTYSPIRKRHRYEPLKDLPKNQEINPQRKQDENDEKLQIVSKTYVDSLTISEIKPTRVDMTLLCDFIDGASNRLDEWLDIEITSDDYSHEQNENNNRVNLIDESGRRSKNDAGLTSNHLQEENVLSNVQNDNIFVHKEEKEKDVLKHHENNNRTFEKLPEVSNENNHETSDDNFECFFKDMLLKIDDRNLIDISVEEIETEVDFAKKHVAVSNEQIVPLSEDWLKEYKQDEFWGIETSVEKAKNSYKDNFNLEIQDLFSVDQISDLT